MKPLHLHLFCITFLGAVLAWGQENNLPIDTKYSYRGKEIDRDKFEHLWANCKRYIFTDGEAYYNLIADGGLKPINGKMPGDAGKLEYKVIQVVDKGSLLIEDRAATSDSTYLLSGLQTENITDGQTGIAMVVRKGTFSYVNALRAKSTVGKLITLRPVTQAEFQSYLNTGATLYVNRSSRPGGPLIKAELQ